MFPKVKRRLVFGRIWQLRRIIEAMLFSIKRDGSQLRVPMITSTSIIQSQLLPIIMPMQISDT